MLLVGLHFINCNLAFKTVDSLFQCLFAIFVGICQSIDYEVVLQEVMHVYMYGHQLFIIFCSCNSRPILDLQSMLQVKHMKTSDSCCGSDWSCSVQAVFLA